MRRASRAARSLAGRELVPEWGPSMPRPAQPTLPKTTRQGAAAVYVPACINRIFGASRAQPDATSLPEAVVRVSERAGLPVWIPPDVAGSCCGTPWASKGYRDGHGWMANRIVERLWGWSDEGALPTVIDASSCTHALLDEVPSALGDDNRERHGQLEVIDAVSWARDQLVPRLAIRGKLGSVTVHPTCGGRHVGLDRSLRALAGELADEVHVPPSATCCGFAGDRGFLHPELTEAATLEEAAEIRSGEFDAYVSSNRTCEIGLERATGEPYVHVVQLLEKLTR